MKVPEVPKLMTVLEVVSAGPPGEREVEPRAKPEGRGVNVWPAAEKMELGAVGKGGVGEGRARVVGGPEAGRARMPALEGRAL